MMVTGGTEAAITPMGISGFAAMRALSERNDDPSKASRPFDGDRDGFVLSEGAGLLVLEELEHAKTRGARIYGEVLGYGASADGGAYHAARRARHRRRQGDGTGPGRRAHRSQRSRLHQRPRHQHVRWATRPRPSAIKRVFGEHAYKLSVSSTKSQLGHLLGASGGVELVLTVLALRDGVIPPTINLDNPDPQCDLDYTPNVAREQQLTAAHVQQLRLRRPQRLGDRRPTPQRPSIATRNHFGRRLKDVGKTA